MVGEKTKNILYDSDYDENKEPLLKKDFNEKEAIIKLQNLLIIKDIIGVLVEQMDFLVITVIKKLFHFKKIINYQ